MCEESGNGASTHLPPLTGGGSRLYFSPLLLLRLFSFKYLLFFWSLSKVSWEARRDESEGIIGRGIREGKRRVEEEYISSPDNKGGWTVERYVLGRYLVGATEECDFGRVGAHSVLVAPLQRTKG